MSELIDSEGWPMCGKCGTQLYNTPQCDVEIKFRQMGNINTMAYNGICLKCYKAMRDRITEAFLYQSEYVEKGEDK